MSKRPQPGDRPPGNGGKPWQPQWQPPNGGNGGGGGGGGKGGGKGGGGGGGKGGGGKKGPFKGLTLDQLWSAGWNIGRPNQQARRDIDLMLDPQYRAIDAAGKEAKDTFGEYDSKAQGLYQALNHELTQMGNQMPGDFAPIQENYTGGVQDILAALGQSSAPDQQGFLGLLGSQALAGQNELTSNQNRQMQLNQGTTQAGNVEGLTLRRNIAGDLNDTLGQLRDKRLAVDETRPELFKQRADELRQLAFERMMAMKEYGLRNAAVQGQNKSNKAMQQWLQNQLGDLNGGGGGGGGGNGGGGGGGGNGGPGGGGPGGGDPMAGQQAFQSVFSGDKRFGSLASPVKQDVRQFARTREGKIENAYDQRFNGGANTGLMEMLKAVSRSRAHGQPNPPGGNVRG